MKKLTSIQIRNRMAILCKGQHVAEVVDASLKILREASTAVSEPEVRHVVAKGLREIAESLESIPDQVRH